jgi:hypothetical protein
VTTLANKEKREYGYRCDQQNGVHDGPNQRGKRSRAFMMVCHPHLLPPPTLRECRHRASCRTAAQPGSWVTRSSGRSLSRQARDSGGRRNALPHQKNFLQNGFHRKASPFRRQKPLLDRFLREGAWLKSENAANRLVSGGIGTMAFIEGFSVSRTVRPPWRPGLSMIS